MTNIAKLCTTPGVQLGLLSGTVSTVLLGAVTVAPWREISVISACATTGALIGTVSLITLAVKTIFDIFMDDGYWRTAMEWHTKMATAIPFTTYFLNQSIFTKDLGVASVFKVGSAAAMFQTYTYFYAVLFMVTCVAEVVKLIQEKKTFSNLV